MSPVPDVGGSGRGARRGLGSRADALERLGRQRFDLLVVGGGITGAGIALDAATRGLSVALAEARDFSSGTSSRSSKLVHGGLRYLEHGEIGLVRQSARERELLRRLAPHVVWPLEFVLPQGPGNLLLRAGLATYDLLAGIERGRRHREISRRAAAELAAGLDARSGAFVYHDCGTDDSRLTLEVLRAACAAGAVVCNHLEVVEVVAVRDRVAGCTARDALGGGTLAIRAEDVVNAAGVWADGVRRLEAGDAPPALRPSKGIHLVLPRAVLPLTAACLFPAGDGRRLFAVPWRSSVVVGPTDTDYTGPLDAPSAEATDVDGILAALSAAFDRPFDASMASGAFAGLRPLVSDPHATATRDLSRRHSLTVGPSGMVTITGGKLTTYRRMAEEAVGVVVARRGFSRRSVTARTPLLRADPVVLRRHVSERAAALGLGPGTARSLVCSYGDRAPEVLDLAEAEDLCAPLVPGLPYLAAEVLWAGREELAATAGDVLARRTRVDLEDPCGGLGDPERLVGLLARSLGVTAAGAAAQLDAYRAALVHERGPVPVLQAPVTGQP